MSAVKKRSDLSSVELPPRVLCIGGVDPTGASGVVADLRTLHSLGVYGAVAVTATTAQTSVSVTDVSIVSASLIEAQIEAALSEPGVDVVKTGMLASEDGVFAVARALFSGSKGIRLVIDPVLVSSSGRRLLSSDGVAALKEELLPRAALVTPNLPELGALAGSGVDSEPEQERAAERLLLFGASAVLVKGGHDPGDGQVVDRLYTADGERHIISGPRKVGPFRGTGCALSSAIAAFLAEGLTLAAAADRARRYVEAAMDAPRLPGLGAFLLPGVVAPRESPSSER